ncbi:aminoacyl-tRNA hydrolase [archaeon CG07_land_8_20_14_0_80_38_8]|nr:MAG: aminoacyl-tRNA hydrolase [archaeon CG07_land_8_20_14_0_80_38_8]PIU88459.1 MAG: aminoacyl-tRNA hydrolase [archaeon CG06_land_8_20_14_3_00_37_11]
MALKQAIIVRADLKMGRGKIASQASHASVSTAYKSWKKNAELFNEWKNEGMPKIVLKVNSEKDILKFANEAGKNNLIFDVIRDAGRTQIPPNTITALGIGPDNEEKIDKIVKNLKLL